MSFKKFYLSLLLLSVCYSTQAATYYVDSQTGDDTWSGTVPTATATDGPWRSLSKVAATTLLPGDNVLLSCNGVWNETLKINQSGTSAAPISVGPYGASCTNQPLITGSRKIPAYAWQPHAAGVWKVQFPFSLIKNGDISSGPNGWSIFSTSNDASIDSYVTTCSAGKAAPCLNISTSKNNGLLSSTPFPLEKGATYTVNFSTFYSAKQIVPNGNLTAGTAPWTSWATTNDLRIQPGTSTCLAGRAAPCLSVVSNLSNGLLSSGNFALKQGETYTLSFATYIPTGKTIKAIVRQSGGTYKPLGLVSGSIVGNGQWQNQTLSFTANATENVARLDFEIPTASNIQLQNVSLRPTGKTVQAVIRQNGGSFQPLGLNVTTNSTENQWQDASYTFVATDSSPNARLDFDIPLNSKAEIQNIVLKKSGDTVSVSQLLDNDISFGIAHHPNAGFNAALPDTPFFKTATSSAVVLDANGKKGSSYFNTSTDLFLPAGASINAGTQVTIRDQNWNLSKVTVSSVSGNRVNITPNTTYPLYWAGLGYFFTGELWMLDSPGEWYFNSATQTLYHYPRGATPDGDIQIASNIYGIDLKGKSYVQVNGITIDGVGLGLDAQASTGISLNNLDIRNTETQGVLATGANTLLVQNSKFTRIGLEGIKAWNSANSNVLGNSFDQIGVSIDEAGKVVSVPATSVGAVVLGNVANIDNNSITNFAYIGINPGNDSIVQNNYLGNGCLLLNDCGAIYLASRDTVTNNLINGLVGNILGLPSAFYPHTVGVYSDYGGDSNIIKDNTVSFSSFGIQIHDSANDTIQNNLLYGARIKELWAHETSIAKTATGDVHGLVVDSNKIFPIISGGELRLSSTQTSLEDFGTFDRNVYSTYITPYVATEGYKNGSTKSYTLAQWQLATANGTSRNLDTSGSIGAPLNNYALGLLKSNIIPNAAFQNGLTGWSRYGSGGTSPTFVVEKCTTALINCVKVTSSTVPGNLSTPTFSVKKDYSYLLSFDVQTTSTTETINAVVRQAGPTYYNTLMPTLTGIQGTSSWKRYSVIFKATANAPTDGSVTGVSGARIDFTGISAGQSIWLANIELVPVGDVPLTKTSAIVSNTDQDPQFFDCPVSNTLLCSNFVNFVTGSKVNWPVALQPLESIVVYSQSLDFPDNDKDGIPNSQDTCPGTPLGAPINSKGCPIQ